MPRFTTCYKRVIWLFYQVSDPCVENFAEIYTYGYCSRREPQNKNWTPLKRENWKYETGSIRNKTSFISTVLYWAYGRGHHGSFYWFFPIMKSRNFLPFHFRPLIKGKNCCRPNRNREKLTLFLTPERVLLNGIGYADISKAVDRKRL